MSMASKVIIWSRFPGAEPSVSCNVNEQMFTLKCPHSQSPSPPVGAAAERRVTTPPTILCHRRHPPAVAWPKGPPNRPVRPTARTRPRPGSCASTRRPHTHRKNNTDNTDAAPPTTGNAARAAAAGWWWEAFLGGWRRPKETKKYGGRGTSTGVVVPRRFPVVHV